MGILDLKTNLKSLRYGKDRPFGGSSNQPYIQREIPEGESEVGRTGGPDFLLRGGTLVPRRVGNDVSRMTQMLFDLKSPNGPLFTAKQNVLSRTAVAVDGIGQPLNAGAYLPTSTIVQTGGGFLGLHANKQGINPLANIGSNSNNRIVRAISEFNPLGQPTYKSLISLLNPNDSSPGKSKLLTLTDGKLKSPNDNILLEYSGGPGSINGIGKTRIRRYENTNINRGYTSLQFISTETSIPGVGNTNIIDFRQEPGGSKVKSVDYRTKNFETRVNLGNPGLKSRDRSDYRNTDNSLSPTNPEKGALDKVNAYPIYKSSGVDISKTQSGVLNDFVKFRIGIIDNNEPNKKVFIHFRALIDSFNDTYNAEWNPSELMGRGEKFYRYNGFTRQISLSWTVAAQSKAELIPQYQKLNYLASSLAPDYSQIGYMRGNLATLTFGAYLHEQPGIITNMSLSIPQESPWEIGLDSSAVKEMPHYVKVNSFNFIPIHDFTPRLQQNQYEGTDGWISAYGKERYIALSNGAPGDKFGKGGNNNYGTTDGRLVNGADNYIPV